jgi:hypothetical protein
LFGALVCDAFSRETNLAAERKLFEQLEIPGAIGNELFFQNDGANTAVSTCTHKTENLTMQPSITFI